MNLGDLLLPTDFSPASETAGIVARAMAHERGVRLHIIHVVPPVTDPEDSAEKLKRLAAEIGKDLPVESALLSGRVAHQIIRYARDKGIGLIVLGTHGRTGVSRVLLGSVAESVVRLASCPVLTVPASPRVGGTRRGGDRGARPRALHRLRDGKRGPRVPGVPHAHPRRGSRAEARRRVLRSPGLVRRERHARPVETRARIGRTLHEDEALGG